MRLKINNKVDKKIGIWGFGIVGKSAVLFFKNNNQIQVFDTRVLSGALTSEEQEFLKNHHISIATDLDQFLENNDIIIPSPSVRLENYYKKYEQKWWPEFDIFGHFFKKPIIAITGSVGKTSVTKLLSDLLCKSGKNYLMGGNIGIACLDLVREDPSIRSLRPFRASRCTQGERRRDSVSTQNCEGQITNYFELPQNFPSSDHPECPSFPKALHKSLGQNQKNDGCIEGRMAEPSEPDIKGAILEASSYQLTHTKSFAPNIAILTNIYPNHLDWHGTEQAYFEAKARIFMHQMPEHIALVPLNLKTRLELYQNSVGKIIKSQLNYFHDTKPTEQEFASMGEQETLFYLDIKNNNKIIKKYSRGTHQALLDITTLPSLTFDQNWLVICSTLHLMGVSLEQIVRHAQQISIPQHRLEKCASINNIEIYNDSKATTTASTLAAVNQLQRKPIILILGGLSKGVDRAPFIEALKNKVKKIYCFGSEAETLTSYCKQYGIAAEKLDSLDSVVQETISQACPGDQILFSPSGSSFDLFKDYEHRGTVFKELVKKYTQNL